VDDHLRPAAPPERSPQLLQLVQHVLVVSMVVLGLSRPAVDGGMGSGEVAVALAMLGWYAVGVLNKSPFSTVRRGVWVAGLSVLCVLAVWITPDYAWVSFAVFVVFANALAPTAAMMSIGALAVATGAVLVGRWSGDGNWTAQIVGPLVGAAVAGALVGITRLAATEVAERQRLLEELIATRDDLAQAHLDAGALAERERITREIHDTLAQGFTSVVLAARRARHSAEHGDDAASGAEIEHLEMLGQCGVDDARRLMAQLPPVELDGRPLPAALGLLVRIDRSCDIPVIEVRVDGEPRPLRPGVDLALLRVAQEAVNNASRHADADRVVLTLTYQSTVVRLDVADDGVGFEPARRTERFGLAGMRSRVEQLGGSLVVESTVGESTVVCATVPYAPSRFEGEP